MYIVGTNRIVLHTRILETVEHTHHFHTYVITRTTNFKIITPHDLYTPSLLHVRQLRADGCNKLVLVPKYAILSRASYYC